MTSENGRWRERILAEIIAYEDDELIQQAWNDFAEWEASDKAKEDLERDLKDAVRQLSDLVVLSQQGRGRLRSFLFTKRVQDFKRKQ